MFLNSNLWDCVTELFTTIKLHRKRKATIAPIWLYLAMFFFYAHLETEVHLWQQNPSKNHLEIPRILSVFFFSLGIPRPWFHKCYNSTSCTTWTLKQKHSRIQTLRLRWILEETWVLLFVRLSSHTHTHIGSAQIRCYLLRRCLWCGWLLYEQDKQQQWV